MGGAHGATAEMRPRHSMYTRGGEGMKEAQSPVAQLEKFRGDAWRRNEE